jgi:hypothetical protein
MMKRIILGAEAATRWAAGEGAVQEHFKKQADRVANKLGEDIQIVDPEDEAVLYTTDINNLDEDPPTQPYRPRIRRETAPYWSSRPCADHF